MMALCWTFIGLAVLRYAYAAYVILCAIALTPCKMFVEMRVDFFFTYAHVATEHAHASASRCLWHFERFI